jgi:C-terminal peptidase prc
VSLLVVTVVLLWALPAAAEQGPSNCSTVSQNLYVRDVMTDIYYWYDFLPPVNAADYPSPEAYLEAVRYRPLDSYFSYITSAAASDAFFSESQYIGLGFSTQITSSEMRVLQVFDDSPASEAGLGRGHRITQIDGQSVAVLIQSGRIDSALGPSEIGYSVEITFDTREGVSRRATLTKRLVTIPTVSVSRVFEVEGRRVGYVFFRNFVRPSYAALDQAFAALREAGATELVLDLRYNGGGLVDVAVHLSSLIGGTPTAGRVMATYEHNRKNSALDRTLRFETLGLSGFSRLIAITSRSSASASELVINALKPYMPVVIIGDATYGKPVGQYGFTFCDKVLFPVSFTIRNANGEADYFSGFQPTCAAPDDITHDLGDPSESSFAEALRFIRTGACSPQAALASRALRATDTGRRAVGWQSVVNAW